MTETSHQSAAVRAAIERWFHDNFANSPVSRSVEAINHLRASLDALEVEIAATLTKET
ncbi:MAG TPA: hypothetical protein VKZ79_03550 [Alphaproteobacteria bacterium]|nr:hypothetical protein [Alphaproteobacteria bacterium]